MTTTALTDEKTLERPPACSKLKKAVELAHVAMADPTREHTIAAIREALRARSGRTWSVTGGRGTAYGWLTIDAPPARRIAGHTMTAEDAAELGRLLGFERPCQAQQVPASSAYRRVFIQRALTGSPNGYTAEPYWD